MKITVYKYNPMVDSEPSYVSADIPFVEKMTGLYALMYFDEHVEHINFDHSCRGRNCGRCAMMVNGEPTLICLCMLDENTDYVFEPLAGFPVVRDLVVDKHPMDDKLSGLYHRIKVEPFNVETFKVDRSVYDDETMWLTYPIDYCCRCGCCNAACPALAAHPGDYCGPAAMLALAYRNMDPLDTGDRTMQAVSEGLFHCIMCGKCDEVCMQNDIDHLAVWQRLRDDAVARGIVPSYAMA